jgi:uncharacterized protein YbbK (DUF523 family)
MAHRLRVGISSCLLGQRVRYDGGHRHEACLTDLLGPHVDWVPVCPEVEVGMGTPREPIRLRRRGEDTRLVGVSSGTDHTDAMRGWASRRLEELGAGRLHGYVLKARSPSCGLAVAVEGAGTEPGMFAAALLERFPGLPVAEEESLRDAASRAVFLDRARAYRAGPA